MNDGSSTEFITQNNMVKVKEKLKKVRELGIEKGKALLQNAGN
jgi:hypothetical protein